MILGMDLYNQIISEMILNEQQYSYGCLMLEIPNPMRQRIYDFANSIPDSEISKDGRIDFPHVTIKYGIHTDNVEEIVNIVKPIKMVQMIFGDISIFSQTYYDVLKIDVFSPQCVALNRMIKQRTKTTDTFNNYKPHATIAYLKKGNAQKYLADPKKFHGIKVTSYQMSFTTKDDSRYLIDLKSGVISPDFKAQ